MFYANFLYPEWNVTSKHFFSFMLLVSFFSAFVVRKCFLFPSFFTDACSHNMRWDLDCTFDYKTAFMHNHKQHSSKVCINLCLFRFIDEKQKMQICSPDLYLSLFLILSSSLILLLFAINAFLMITDVFPYYICKALVQYVATNSQQNVFSNHKCLSFSIFSHFTKLKLCIHFLQFERKSK